MDRVVIIGQRIRKLRNSKMLTQKELGELLNMNKTTISHYEKGERSPSIETLIKISDYFKVDIEYVLGINNVGKSPDREIKLSDEEIKFIIEIRKISVYKNIISNPINYARLIDMKTSGYKIKN